MTGRPGSGRFSRAEPPENEPPENEPPVDQCPGQELTPEQMAALNWWYDSLPGSELRLLLDRHTPAPAAEAFAAGFTHGLGGNGTGFEAGGELDVMLPGGQLAISLGRVRQRGLAALSDDALVGAMGGAAKLESFAAGFKLAAAAELGTRRAAEDGTPGKDVNDELAAALNLTNWSAAAVLGLAQELARLPQTSALLAAGIIDARRAAVIARHTLLLSDDDAAKVEDMVLPRAGAMTTGELNSFCLRAVTAIDPAAARKRKEKALADARVEAWFEDAGTAALAGRDLPPADVVAADQYINAAARWLKEHGAPGTLQQLRAKAFTALLAGQSLHHLLESLLPAADDVPAAQDTPATEEAAPEAAAGQDTTSGDSGGAGSSSGPALGGTVNLTMPLSAWLGQSDNPGEIGGYGAADAATCRDIATRLTAGMTRWCITLTDRNGNAIGHGCARAGPGPPGTGEATSWLAAVRVIPIETGACSHRHESAGYQPSPSLRHIVKTRSRRCGYPGCRRAAVRCDDDHTIPFHLGGRSCECNLYPLCRQHHQCKQNPGWHLEQPRPGHLIWTTPSGRTYTKSTEPYPV